MDLELKQKKIELQFLEDKKGIPVSKVIEEMNRIYLNEKSSKDKNGRIMNRLKKTLNNHKYKKN